MNEELIQILEEAKRGNYSSNILLLEKYIEYDDPDIYFYLGYYLLFISNEKNKDKGIEYLNKAVELGKFEALELLGNYYKDKKDKSNALYFYKKAYKEGISTALSTILELDNNKNNIIYLNSLIEEDKDDPLPYLELGKIYLSLGNAKLAISNLKEASSLSNSESSYLLGKIYYEGKLIKKNKEEALHYFRKINPYDEEFVYLSIQYYLKEKDIDKIKELYLSIIFYKDSSYQLALLFYKEGDVSNGLKYLIKADELNIKEATLLLIKKYKNNEDGLIYSKDKILELYMNIYLNHEDFNVKDKIIKLVDTNEKYLSSNLHEYLYALKQYKKYTSIFSYLDKEHKNDEETFISALYQYFYISKIEGEKLFISLINKENEYKELSLIFLLTFGSPHYKIDPIKAIKMIKKIEEKELSLLYFLKGIMYELGYLYEKDYLKAIEAYAYSAKKGNILSLIRLKDLYILNSYSVSKKKILAKYNDLFNKEIINKNDIDKNKEFSSFINDRNNYLLLEIELHKYIGFIDLERIKELINGNNYLPIEAMYPYLKERNIIKEELIPINFEEYPYGYVIDALTYIEKEEYVLAISSYDKYFKLTEEASIYVPIISLLEKGYRYKDFDLEEIKKELILYSHYPSIIYLLAKYRYEEGKIDEDTFKMFEISSYYNADAYIYLALFYYHGLYVEKDEMIASNYNKKALKRGASIYLDFSTGTIKNN